MLPSKNHILLSSLFIFSSTIAQIKLCQDKSVMYSKCYTLNDNGTFKFEGNYCGVREIGKGTFIKNKRGITFVFDSIKPKEIKKELKGDANKISIQSLATDTGQPDKLITIIYKNKFYNINKQGSATIDYDGGEILFNNDNNPEFKKINPNLDNANHYIIYTDYLSSLTLNGEIHKFRKKRNKYKFTDYISVYKEKRGKYIKRKKVYTYIEKT